MTLQVVFMIDKPSKEYAKFYENKFFDYFLLLLFSYSFAIGKVRNTGLLNRHSYSLTDAKEGYGHKLVCIRNPWGYHEWKGNLTLSSLYFID